MSLHKVKVRGVVVEYYAMKKRYWQAKCTVCDFEAYPKYWELAILTALSHFRIYSR